MGVPVATGPDVSCVIVAFHRPAVLAPLVASLADARIEVVVVNVEDDAAVRAIAGASTVPLRTNPGYGAAVNAGARVARGAVIAFMNDDVRATASDVLALADRVCSSVADVVVPVVIGPDGRPECADRLPYGLATRMQLRGDPLPDHPVRIDAAWASVVVCRADLLRAVPLAEDYFMYWEELDWFCRLRRSAARVELMPGVRVEHLGGPHVHRPDKSRLMARNAVRCVRRNRGRLAALSVWPRVVWWQGRLLLRSAVRGAEKPAFAAHSAGLAAALAAWREIAILTWPR